MSDHAAKARMDVRVAPNAETVEAMTAARRGEVVQVGGVEELLADLHEDDSPQGLRANTEILAAPE